VIQNSPFINRTTGYVGKAEKDGSTCHVSEMFAGALSLETYEVLQDKRHCQTDIVMALALRTVHKLLLSDGCANPKSIGEEIALVPADLSYKARRYRQWIAKRPLGKIKH